MFHYTAVVFFRMEADPQLTTLVIILNVVTGKIPFIVLKFILLHENNWVVICTTFLKIQFLVCRHLWWIMIILLMFVVKYFNFINPFRISLLLRYFQPLICSSSLCLQLLAFIWLVFLKRRV